MPASKRTRGAIRLMMVVSMKMNRETLHFQVLSSQMSAFANHPLAIAIHIRGPTMLTPSLEIRVQTPVTHLLTFVNRIQVLAIHGVASAKRNLFMVLVRSQRMEMWKGVSCKLSSFPTDIGSSESEVYPRWHRNYMGWLFGSWIDLISCIHVLETRYFWIARL